MEQLLFPLAAVYDPPINMDLTKPSLLLLLLVPTSTSYLFFYCSGRIFFRQKNRSISVWGQPERRLFLSRIKADPFISKKAFKFILFCVGKGDTKESGKHKT